MIKLGPALASLALVFTTLVIIAPSAQAHTAPCVSRAEFKQIDGGLAKADVHSIVDFNGSQVMFDNAPGLPPFQVRQYRTCTHSFGQHGKAFVEYEKPDGTWLVVGKAVFW